MKTLEIKKKEQCDSSLVEAIHQCARANGSKFRIDLNQYKATVYARSSYSNAEHTKGYFAVLYLIDCLNDTNIAYTKPGICDQWFNIKVVNEEALIDYLKG